MVVVSVEWRTVWPTVYLSIYPGMLLSIPLLSRCNLRLETADDFEEGSI